MAEQLSGQGPSAHCRKCGADIVSGQGFCPHCGAGLGGQVVIVNPPPREGFVQRHLILTIVIVVVFVACILPLCASAILAGSGNWINSEFNRITATLEAPGIAR